MYTFKMDGDRFDSANDTLRRLRNINEITKILIGTRRKKFRQTFLLTFQLRGLDREHVERQKLEQTITGQW